MSYSRWSDDCDVYVYAIASDHDGNVKWHCCMCKYKDDMDDSCHETATPSLMVEHMMDHIKTGDKVPSDVLGRLMATVNDRGVVY